MPDPTPFATDRLAGRHVLFLHAHPDDETIATGGTIARLVEAGTLVSVLTATRGECGETAPGSAPENLSAAELVALRSQELTGALAELGVQQHFWLGTRPARALDYDRQYSDSGMQWGPDGWAVPADDVPDTALSNADLDEVTADVLALITAIDPELVVSYDARGGYGHPDHVRAHRASRAAAALAGIGFAECLPGRPLGATDAADTDGTADIADAADTDGTADIANTADTDGTADTAGAQDAGGGEVIAVDVSAQRERVVRALRCYRTQLVSVSGDHLVHVGGQRQEIPSVEYYRIR